MSENIRPVLGVTCCNRPFGGETAQVVIDRYVTAAMRYGDVAALLVPALPDLMSAREVAPRLDGLLLTGSPSNIEPARYGGPGPGDGPFDPARDEMTLALIKEMVRLKKPVVGVCRGFEEVNVAFGGSLARQVDGHHAPDDASLEAMFAHAHEVALEPAGKLASAYGRQKLNVNSVHYQAIDRLGPGLAVEARAPDGLIEAVSADHVLAVQWHPEWRTEANPDSQTFFALMGRMLRKET
jgi:putative glutamine amidotransferase